MVMMVRLKTPTGARSTTLKGRVNMLLLVVKMARAHSELPAKPGECVGCSLRVRKVGCAELRD
jgi:hypothetical protein